MVRHVRAPTDERARLIRSYLPLANSLSRRFRPSGEAHDDLRQVAALAVVRAVDRRDPSRPATLPAYVARCVEGELRRHLRDASATVRIPRAADRRTAAAVTARSPLALEERDVPPDPYDAPEAILDRVVVARAARRLDARERRVVLLHFFLDRTQTQIAAELGISQPHVSRLLGDALAKMRRDMAGFDPLYRDARNATLDTSGNANDTRSDGG
jgi:RNA polymerase sigma-B factor